MLIHIGLLYNAKKPGCKGSSVEDIETFIPETAYQGKLDESKAFTIFQCNITRKTTCYTFEDAGEYKWNNDIKYWWYIDPYLKDFGIRFGEKNKTGYSSDSMKTWERHGAKACENHRELGQLRGSMRKLTEGGRDTVYNGMQLFGSFYKYANHAAVEDHFSHCNYNKSLEQIKNWQDCWFNDWALTLKGPAPDSEAKDHDQDLTPFAIDGKATLYSRSREVPWSAVGCKAKARIDHTIKRPGEPSEA